VTYPYIEISRLAKKESWRKEVNRPIYHLHKWWAQRLGSVFRANVIHAIEPSNNEWLSFYQKHDYAATVLDPFMGSGTTLGEALKVGCNVVGCDINPVSTFLVQEELRHVDLWEVQREYERIDAEIGERIRSMHRTVLPNGEVADVLYYFWVVVVKSPTGEELPLFKNYIVSKNAYPSKKPEIWVLCPRCGEVFQSIYTSHSATCPTCGDEYDPWIGRVRGSIVTDGKDDKYKIKDLVSGDEAPEERLYAMLAVDKKGNKHFLKVGQYDLDLYANIESELKKTIFRFHEERSSRVTMLTKPEPMVSISGVTYIMRVNFFRWACWQSQFCPLRMRIFAVNSFVYSTAQPSSITGFALTKAKELVRSGQFSPITSSNQNAHRWRTRYGVLKRVAAVSPVCTDLVISRPKNTSMRLLK